MEGMSYKWHVTIQADGKPPFPRDYKVTGGKPHVAVNRAMQDFERDAKGKRNNEYTIRVRRLAKLEKEGG